MSHIEEYMSYIEHKCHYYRTPITPGTKTVAFYMTSCGKRMYHLFDDPHVRHTLSTNSGLITCEDCKDSKEYQMGLLCDVV